jgi:hypothetical protein
MATSKAYQKGEAPIVWDSVATDESLTLTSVAAGAGRQGALHDFGAMTTARPREYNWRAWVKFATTPVVGEVIYIYWKSSDGTNPDNDDGTGDIAVSAEDKLKGLRILGMIIVDEASATPVFVANSPLPIELTHRHGGPVFWNATADNLSATATDHEFVLTPVPMQGQAT